jgi:exodeoxyribonuclease VII large subunit
MEDQSPEIPIMSVTQFNETVNQVLSDMRVWVKGEIIDFKISRGKWVTFDIKDQGSKLNCFMTVYQLDQELEDGMEVKIFGNPRIYVPYGKFSFTVQRVEPVGEGALRRAFDLTKKKLEEEGLFSDIHKKPLPQFPTKIGIVTSEEAAAYTDFLQILNNRWGGVTTILKPSFVQGVNAPDNLVESIDWFNKHQPVDVIVVTRGGGSLEDLQAFNSEKVCRAIFASNIPVVCGVGHERDTTLAELVADRRASTPSNAAEIIVPDREEFLYKLSHLASSLEGTVSTKIESYERFLQDIMQRFDLSLQRQSRSFTQVEHALQMAFQQYDTRLQSYAQMSVQLDQRLNHSGGALFEKSKVKLQQLEQLLTSYNPKSVLQRGYSISRLGNGSVLKSVKQVKQNDSIQTELGDGTIISTVQSKGKTIENGTLF